jgi:hypothetical protein
LKENLQVKRACFYILVPSRVNSPPSFPYSAILESMGLQSKELKSTLPRFNILVFVVVMVTRVGTTRDVLFTVYCYYYLFFFCLLLSPKFFFFSSLLYRWPHTFIV